MRTAPVTVSIGFYLERTDSNFDVKSVFLQRINISLPALFGRNPIMIWLATNLRTGQCAGERERGDSEIYHDTPSKAATIREIACACGVAVNTNLGSPFACASSG